MITLNDCRTARHDVTHDSPLHHVLWTGGWDSTFRMLALLHRGHTVQPYYLVDVSRQSLAREMETITRLKQLMRERFPGAEERLLPTRYYDLADLPGDDGSRLMLERVRSVHWMGDQYAWISQFARMSSIDGLELSIHKDGRDHFGFLAALVVPVSERGDRYYHLPRESATPETELFLPFRFPLLDYTKLDMQEEARRDGYLDILDQTWFCHRPLRNGDPCGTCSPCCCTREEGLGRRIPWRSRLREKARAITRRLGLRR